MYKIVTQSLKLLQVFKYTCRYFHKGNFFTINLYRLVETYLWHW